MDNYKIIPLLTLYNQMHLIYIALYYISLQYIKFPCVHCYLWV